MEPLAETAPPDTRPDSHPEGRGSKRPRSSSRVRVFWDTETTSCRNDAEIVSIGFCTHDLRTSGEFFCLPEGEIDPRAAAVTGLDLPTLVEKGAGTLREALEGFCTALEGISELSGADIELVAHNSKAFDEPKLMRSLTKEGMKLPGCCVAFEDSLLWARRLRPKQPNSLSALAQHYAVDGLEDRSLHGAEVDSRLLARVVAKMLPAPPP